MYIADINGFGSEGILSLCDFDFLVAAHYCVCSFCVCVHLGERVQVIIKRVAFTNHAIYCPIYLFSLRNYNVCVAVVAFRINLDIG